MTDKRVEQLSAAEDMTQGRRQARFATSILMKNFPGPQPQQHSDKQGFDCRG